MGYKGEGIRANVEGVLCHCLSFKTSLPFIAIARRLHRGVKLRRRETFAAPLLPPNCGRQEVDINAPASSDLADPLWAALSPQRRNWRLCLVSHGAGGGIHDIMSWEALVAKTD